MAPLSKSISASAAFHADERDQNAQVDQQSNLTSAPQREKVRQKITVHGGDEQMFGAEEQILGRG
jgi:hypothetical protein